MSEVPEHAALAELLASISDRRIRRKVQKLLGYGEEAVRALGELDAALYLRDDGEEQLQIVSDAVLSHFRRLLEYLGTVAPAPNPSAAGGGASSGGEVDFDLGGDESAPAPRKSGPILAGGVIAYRAKGDEEKWNALAAEIESLQYGLSSELREYDRRFAAALAGDRKEQAVRDLNDATTALMDGVFAVLTTVYECFLGHAEPERMVPGHRDTLGKAIAVRRALADLRREVRTLNRDVQDRAAPKPVAEASYQRIVEATAAFIQQDCFYYLRSDTRRDFTRFRDLLAGGTVARNRNDCEGFDKYLDSLAFVSQRGVLIKHDADMRAKIRADLGRALTYAAILPDLVCDVIEQAFVKADRLAGLNDHIDAVTHQWLALAPEQRTDVDLAVDLGRQLLDLVREAPTPTPPRGGDFL